MDPDDFSDVSASDGELDMEEEPVMPEGKAGGKAAAGQAHPKATSNGVHAAAGAAAGPSAAAALAAAAAAAAATAADREAEAALLAGELTSDAALLQLQANDLLAEVRPRPLKAQAVAGVLQQLRAALASAKPREVPGTLLPGFIRDLGLQPEEVSLSFAAPAAVEAVGSFPLGASPGPGGGVLDVAVVMPEACLHRKDHVNYRWYHARRALYLAALSRHLARSPAYATQWLEPHMADPARPALLVELESPRLTLRLLPVPPRGAFAAHKLAPDRNNVRWVTRGAAAGAAVAAAAAGGGKQVSAAAQQQPAKPAKQQQGEEAAAAGGGESAAAAAEGGAAGEAEWLATPGYNAGVLSDLLALETAVRLGGALQGAGVLRDALLLLKVWARQAALAGGGGGGAGEGGGLGGHLLAAVLLVAAERAGPAAAAMSALQLLRAALQLLADGAAWGRGLALARAPQAAAQGQQAAAGAEAAPPAMGLFRRAHGVVLLDASGRLNLAAGTPPSLLAHAALAARHTLAALDRPADAEAAFAAAFLTPLRPAAAFDYVWAVELPPPPAGAPLGDVCAARQQEEAVETLVRKALTTRAVLVRALPRRLAFPPPPAGGGGAAGALAGGVATPAAARLLVGAVADAAEVCRLVDVGPPADDAAAAGRFRSLWGERAELRRFQDGTICEAVVWEAPPDARHSAPDAAVAHLLGRHLPAGAAVDGSAGRLDAALEARGGGGSAQLGAAAAGRAAEAALDKLGKQLRALGDVVLTVTGVQPLSAASRRTAPFPPAPHPLAGGPGGLAAAAGAAGLPRVVEPLDVMVALEGSGRWPDDPGAYAKMKAAVGCQLAGGLAGAAGFAASPSEEAVDVFVDGFAFRLLLYTDRDAAMHAKAAAAGPHAHHHHAAAHSPPRVLVLSWHHGLIAALEGQHPAYGPTVRLAKRWLGGQLMGSQLGGEAVELIVGAAFCGPAAAPPPASRIAGLLRFLSLLATHPWGRAPLLVDPLREVGPDARRALVREYEARRAAGGAPAMFIASPRDMHTSRWTMERPSAGVLQHLVAAAAAAAEQLAALQERADAGCPPGGWGGLFAAPLGDFDALALLRRDALPHGERLLPGEAARLAKHAARRGGAAARKRGSAEALADAAGGAPAAKSARAVLRAFPAAVLASQPTAALLPELLVGFDPVSRYVSLLEDRFGHLAAFCADAGGGYPAVGVKWLPAAFVPAPLRPALAHAVVEVGPGLGVPNLPQVLGEMVALGEGLVDQVLTL
ncbi:MAG: Nrap protein [Monoraphidium minutum]|nr:MAG: Nrap protein [Monoraphidium minutum]